MKTKERKPKNEISFGIGLGIDIIAITWVLLIIPALLIQTLGVEHNSDTYMNIISVFQIIAAFLATFISIKISLKSQYLLNNNVTKAIISSIITILILIIIDYFIGNLLPIIPFGSIMGVVLIFIVYSVSQVLLRKLYN